ncbi:hypothetical protein NDU88_006010 [Pleurodeles waltl]|uniref:Uncharacterized protein n=1 Tax=Pleurodeles waltl TaxID=8319 RepID=A0AAV7PK92_PLEWA|nr:hypothetical protein NDU88_006010 [Pleurodeles waltl]
MLRDRAETAVGSPGAARGSCVTLGAFPPAATPHFGVAFRDPWAAREDRALLSPAQPCSPLDQTPPRDRKWERWSPEAHVEGTGRDLAYLPWRRAAVGSRLEDPCGQGEEGLSWSGEVEVRLYLRPPPPARAGDNVPQEEGGA